MTDDVERCEHGIRWPHPCNDCEAEALKPHNLIAQIEAKDATIATLQAKVAELTEEGRILSSGSCDVVGGKLGDGRGNSYCALQAKLDKAVEGLDAMTKHRIAAEKAVLDRLDAMPMNPVIDMAFEKWRVLLTLPAVGGKQRKSGHKRERENWNEYHGWDENG